MCKLRLIRRTSFIFLVGLNFRGCLRPDWDEFPTTYGKWATLMSPPRDWFDLSMMSHALKKLSRFQIRPISSSPYIRPQDLLPFPYVVHLSSLSLINIIRGRSDQHVRLISGCHTSGDFQYGNGSRHLSSQGIQILPWEMNLNKRSRWNTAKLTYVGLYRIFFGPNSVETIGILWYEISNISDKFRAVRTAKLSIHSNCTTTFVPKSKWFFIGRSLVRTWTRASISTMLSLVNSLMKH